jgi:putative FmdB family regulatory protein
MPTYEFRCPDGHQFEKFYRKISDATGEVLCPTCGKVAERQISAGAGLVFKGSGFYLTDYGKNAHRKAGASTSTDSSGGDKSESKGDSKGDTKTDSSTGKSSSGDKSADTAPAAESGSSKSTVAKPAESKKKPSPKSDS